MGFLVVNDGDVKLSPAQYMAPIDRVIEMLPELMGDIKNSIRSGRERKSAPGVSKSGLPDYSNMQKSTYPTETGMYVAPENVPCEVCDETARSMHPTTQGSFEDPKVHKRMEENGEAQCPIRTIAVHKALCTKRSFTRQDEDKNSSAQNIVRQSGDGLSVHSPVMARRSVEKQPKRNRHNILSRISLPRRA